MRKDVLNQIKLLKEEIDVLNKSELARRFNCDRRTIDKYIKDSSSESRKPREIKKKVDDFKEKGIKMFIYMGADIVETLDAFAKKLGVENEAWFHENQSRI